MGTARDGVELGERESPRVHHRVCLKSISEHQIKVGIRAYQGRQSSVAYQSPSVDLDSVFPGLHEKYMNSLICGWIITRATNLEWAKYSLKVLRFNAKNIATGDGDSTV